MSDGRIIIDALLDSKLVQKGVDEINKKVKSIDFKKMGSSLTQSVTLPLAVAGGAVVKMTADAGSAQGRLQAQLGLTKKEAESLKGVAEDVFVNGWGDSMQDVTDSIAKVKQNMGDLDGKELQSVTEGALMLRDVFEADVNESTRAASALVKNFGIDGTQALDMITVAYQKGGDYSGELLDTITEYAPQFDNMGISAEAMFDILLTGAKNGAWNMDKVGDAVKEFHIRAQDGSKGTKEGFEAIGLDAEEMGAKIAVGGEEGEKAFMATIAALAAMEDPVARNQAGVALFGTQWEDLNEKVVTSMANSKGALGDFEGATGEAGKAVQDNFGTQLTSTMRDLGVALQPIGEILIDMLSKAVPYIQSFAQWLQNLSPTTQTVIVVLGILAAILGPLLIAFGALLPVLGALAVAFGTTVGGVLLIIGAIVLVTAAVVAFGIFLYKNWDDIKAKTVEFGQKVKDTVTSKFNELKTAAGDKIAELKENVSKKYQEMKQDAINKITEWKTSSVNKFNELKTDAINKVSELKTGAVNKIQELKTGATNKFQELKTAATNKVSETKTSVVNKFNELKTGAVNKAEELKRQVADKFFQLRSKIVDPIQNAKDKVLEIIGNIKNAFSKMKIEIPKPRIPKIDVSMGSKNVGGVKIPFPNFDFSWYAKGGVFDGASVIGVGEQPGVKEAVVPLSGRNMQPFAEAIAKMMPAGTNTDTRPVNLEVAMMIDGEEMSRVMQRNIDLNQQDRASIKIYAKGGRRT